MSVSQYICMSVSVPLYSIPSLFLLHWPGDGIADYLTGFRPPLSLRGQLCGQRKQKNIRFLHFVRSVWLPAEHIFVHNRYGNPAPPISFHPRPFLSEVCITSQLSTPSLRYKLCLFYAAWNRLAHFTVPNCLYKALPFPLSPRNHRSLWADWHQIMQLPTTLQLFSVFFYH